MASREKNYHRYRARFLRSAAASAAAAGGDGTIRAPPQAAGLDKSASCCGTGIPQGEAAQRSAPLRAWATGRSRHSTLTLLPV